MKRGKKQNKNLEFKLQKLDEKDRCKQQKGYCSLLDAINIINFNFKPAITTKKKTVNNNLFVKTLPQKKTLLEEEISTNNIINNNTTNTIIINDNDLTKKQQVVNNNLKKIDLLKFACLKTNCIYDLRTYIQNSNNKKFNNNCLAFIGSNGIGKYFVAKLLAEQLNYKIINFSIKDLFEQQENYNFLKKNNNNDNGGEEEEDQTFQFQSEVKGYEKKIIQLKTIFNNINFLNGGQKSFVVIRDLDFIFDNYFTANKTDSKKINDLLGWIIDEFVEKKHFAHNLLQIPIFILRDKSNFYIRKLLKNNNIVAINFFATTHLERIEWLNFLNRNLNFETLEQNYNTAITECISNKFLYLINQNLQHNKKNFEAYIEKCSKFDGGDIRNMMIKLFYWFTNNFKENSSSSSLGFVQQQLLENNDFLKQIYVLNIFDFCKYMFDKVPILFNKKYDKNVDNLLNVIVERIKELKMGHMLEHYYKQIFNQYFFKKQQSVVTKIYDLYSRIDLLNIKNEWNMYGQLKLESYKDFILVNQLAHDVNEQKKIQNCLYLENYNFKWISNNYNNNNNDNNINGSSNNNNNNNLTTIYNKNNLGYGNLLSLLSNK